MKKIMFLFVALLVGLFLASCSNAKYSFEITEVTSARNKATFAFEFKDPENQLQTSELKYLVTLKGNTSPISSGVISKDEKSFTVSSLTVATTYEITVTTAYQGAEVTLVEKKEFSTGNQGSSADNPYLITTADDFINVVSNDNEGYYKLANDIDLSEKSIGTLFASNYFRGTFDGNNKTIFNYTLGSSTSRVSNGNYLGFFGVIDEKGVVKDLTLKDAKLYLTRSSSSFFGILAAQNSGNISNVKIVDSLINVSGSSTNIQNVGGLVAYNKSNGTITGCTVENTQVIASTRRSINVGGLVGRNDPIADSTTTKVNRISDCSVNNVSVNVSISYDYSVEETHINVGGFIGQNFAKVEDSTAKAYIRVQTNLQRPDDVYAVNIGGFAGQNVTDGSALLSGVIANSSIEAEALTYSDGTKQDEANFAVGLLVGQNGGDFATSSARILASKAIASNSTIKVIAKDNHYKLGVVAVEKKATNDYSLEGELTATIEVMIDEHTTRVDTVNVEKNGFSVVSSEEVVEQIVEENQD